MTDGPRRVTVWLSDELDVEELDDRVDDLPVASRSEYVRRLVEGDLGGDPDDWPPTDESTE